jgi:hypothetical protein
MKKVSPVVFVAGIVAALLASLGLGLGIRKVRSWRTETKIESKQQTEPIVAEPVEELIAELRKVRSWRTETESKVESKQQTELIVEEQYPVVEETVEENPEEEPIEYEAQKSRGFGGWRDVWGDINLTEEEQARLREGFRLAMGRWLNMSPEEREAEAARRREMRERWENMSEGERREASERMRDQFEEWRRSGRVELPELSL